MTPSDAEEVLPSTFTLALVSKTDPLDLLLVSLLGGPAGLSFPTTHTSHIRYYAGSVST